MTTQAHSSSALRSLFAYRAWANEELLGALADVNAAAYPAEARNAVRILNHVYVVDCIFQAHLESRAHGYTATNTEETPTVQELAAAVRELDAWYLAYVEGQTPSVLQERISFTFTDGNAGLMSREEILLHVFTHGAYHRGAVGKVMRLASTEPPLDVYTRFLHISEPERRG